MNCLPENELALLGGTPVVNMERFPPWPIYDETDLSNLTDVLKSHKWGGMHQDRYIAEFEKKFSQYHDNLHALVVNSGTSALIMALLALDIGDGDQVIVPTMSFIATASVVSLVKAIPVFVDINQYHCIDINSMENAYTAKTKAVIVVHAAGHPCDMEAIMTWAKKKNVYVIEDCAQAHGAVFNKKLVGTFGDISCFSFAETKNMSCGEGGAILTKSDSLYLKLCALRNHGRPSFPITYKHGRLGSNYRLSEFQAAVLTPQLERLDIHLQRKNEFVKALKKEFERQDFQWISVAPTHEKVTVHGYFWLSLLYHKEAFHNISREKILCALQAEGIPVALIHYMPYGIHRNPIFNDKDNPDYCDNIRFSTPVCDEQHNELIVIGQAVHSAILLDIKNIPYIVEALKKIEKQWSKLLCL